MFDRSRRIVQRRWGVNVKFKNLAGFSLVEMTVVLVILSIIGLVTVRYIASASQAYIQVLAQTKVDGEAFDALKRMRREIRTAQTMLSANTNSLSFVNQSGSTNAFQLSNKTVTLNNYPLVADVDACNFMYYDVTNGVTTNLTLIRRIALDFCVSNKYAVENLKVNFFLEDGILQ